MWIDLYVVAAVLVAVACWLGSPRCQSYDPPSEIERGFWSAAAGALWPLVLVGAAQIYAVHCIMRRVRPTRSEEPELTPLAAVREMSLQS
jgi:hypothetical protein